MATMETVVTEAIWLCPPALLTIWVFVGLPFTTNVPVKPAATFAALSPTRSTFSSNLSLNLAAFRPRRRRALGEDQDEDGCRRPDEGGDVAPPGDRREADARQATRNRAERGDAVGGEIHGPADEDGPQHGDQGSGDLRRELLATEDHDEHAGGHGHRVPADVGDVLQRARELGDRVVEGDTVDRVPLASGQAQHARPGRRRPGCRRRS